jgi:dimethylargininase
MARCELTHLPRTPIDLDRALDQHAEYCRTLRSCGAEIRVLDVNSEFPDCVFVEDTAVVLDEVALLASMGAESRRGEPTGIEAELKKHRSVRSVERPATIEGGDVLRVGRTLLVGRSARTNAAGIDALKSLVHQYGYTVVPVPVRGSLHFKTACTALDDHRLLVNPEWIDERALAGFELIRVPDAEPWAANVARVGRAICISVRDARTADMISRLGYDVHRTDLSEFAKAEGGVTCLSLLFNGSKSGYE